MSKDTKKPHALFGEDEKSKDELIQDSLENDKYTAKIDVPIYEPKNVKPKISELIDKTKTNELVKEIKNSNLRDDEKAFLLNAAQRHTIYNYAKIADYYAYASPKMKELMEKSALVIIDYEKAIEYGFVKLQNIIFDTAEELKKKRDEK